MVDGHFLHICGKISVVATMECLKKISCVTVPTDFEETFPYKNITKDGASILQAPSNPSTSQGRNKTPPSTSSMFSLTSDVGASSGVREILYHPKICLDLVSL